MNCCLQFCVALHCRCAFRLCYLVWLRAFSLLLVVIDLLLLIITMSIYGFSKEEAVVSAAECSQSKKTVFPFIHFADQLMDAHVLFLSFCLCIFPPSFCLPISLSTCSYSTRSHVLVSMFCVSPITQKQRWKVKKNIVKKNSQCSSLFCKCRSRRDLT